MDNDRNIKAWSSNDTEMELISIIENDNSKIYVFRDWEWNHFFKVRIPK